VRYRRTRRDANHAEIVKTLRSVGCSVLDLAAVGGGCPDLLVAGPAHSHNETLLIEVKRPGVAGRKRGRVQNATDDKQKTFRDEWRGRVETVASVEEALRIVGIDNFGRQYVDHHPV